MVLSNRTPPRVSVNPPKRDVKCAIANPTGKVPETFIIMKHRGTRRGYGFTNKRAVVITRANNREV